MVAKQGETRKGRRERIEKGSRERIEKERKVRKELHDGSQFDFCELLKFYPEQLVQQ